MICVCVITFKNCFSPNEKLLLRIEHEQLDGNSSLGVPKLGFRQSNIERAYSISTSVDWTI